MSVETAANRYTCRECRKTYRSFRTQQEWRTSHLADVCTARRAPAPAGPATPPAAPATPPVVHRPTQVPDEDPRPWWQSDVIAVAAATVVGLILLGVALYAYRTLSDPTNGGPRPLQLLMSLAVAGPCLYGTYHMVRSTVPVLHPGGGRNRKR